MSSSSNSRNNGGIVGLGFRPTDEELVDYYLTNKSLGRDSLVQVISEVADICNREPQDLAHLPVAPEIQSNDQVWHFFSPRIPNKRVKRTTNEGYWSLTGGSHQIKLRERMIGYKRVLVFYKGRSTNGKKKDSWTPWVMYEYSLSATLPNQKHFVLCKLFKKDDPDDDDLSSSKGQPSICLTNNLVDPVAEDENLEDGIGTDELLAQLKAFSELDENELWNWIDFDEASTQERSNNQFGLAAENEGSNLSLIGPVSSCFPESSRKRPRFEDGGIIDDMGATPIHELQCGQVEGASSLIDEDAWWENNFQKIPMIETPPSMSPSTTEHQLNNEFREMDAPSDSSAAAYKSYSTYYMTLEKQEYPVHMITHKHQYKQNCIDLLQKEVAMELIPIEGKLSAKTVSQKKAGSVHEATPDSKMNQKRARETKAKISLKMHWNSSPISHRKGFFTFLDAPPLTHKPLPSIYFVNALLGILLFVAIIYELVSIGNARSSTKEKN